MILLLLCAIHLAAAWWQNSKVFTLTAGSFEKQVGSEKHVIVEYFAPWCHWCRRMMDDYEAVWEHYNSPDGLGFNPNILISRINADDHRETVRRQGISAYPAIVYYKPGHNRPYSHFHGDRTTAKFIAWIDNLVEPPAPVETMQLIHEVHIQIKDQPVETDVQMEVEESLEQEEELIQYEFIMTDVAKAYEEKWRGDFSNVTVTLEDLKTAVLEELTVLKAVQGERQTYAKQQATLESNRFHSLEERLERLNYEVLNRNRIEASQIHINPSHMLVFSVIGFVLGCAVALIAAKIQNPRGLKVHKPI